MTPESPEVILARLDVRVENIEKMIANFVTREEIKPIRYISYGIAGTILTGVLGAILKVVLVK